MAVCDHSRSLAIAKGLSLDRLKKQREEIRQLNEELDGFHILSGVEVDILADGRLNYPDEILAEMDVVVASIHTGFNQPGEKITERILAAMQNPHVDIIAHPTGRLLGRREPLAIDVERIIEEVVRTGTILGRSMPTPIGWISTKSTPAGPGKLECCLPSIPTPMALTS